MMRWVLLLGTIAAIYWLYENGYYDMKTEKPRSAESQSHAPSPPRDQRLGGGLNPFVMDDDVDAPPQRPQVPGR